MNLEKFDDQFPIEIRELFTVISREGFSLTLVGGAVRDYLINGKMGNDLDFELRHKFEFEGKKWERKIIRLADRLGKVYGYNLEILPFSIIRVKLQDYAIELSSPRLESYQDQVFYKHSDFNVQLASYYTYKDSFSRRDFTINALGVEFGVIGDEEEFTLVDPFHGYNHLLKKTLVPCNKNFYKDPVRFLRAIRFSLRFNFDYGQSLQDSMCVFDLSGLTLFYFFSEALKADFFLFMKRFFFEVENYNVAIPSNISSLRFLGKYSCKGVKSLEGACIFLCAKGESQESLEKFRELAQLKESFLKSYLAIRDCVFDLKEKGLDQMISTILKEGFDHSGEVSDDLVTLYVLFERRLEVERLLPYLDNSLRTDVESFLELTPEKISLSSQQKKELNLSSSSWKKFYPLFSYLASL